MPKTKQQKIETVKALSEGLKNAKGAVLADFQGLSVADFEELRRRCRAEEVKVLVAKKSLFKKAFQEAGLDEVEPKAFSGGVAVFMGCGDEVAPARIVSVFAEDHEVVAIHGGIFQGKFVAAAVVKNLASLPGKKELLYKLAAAINAPVSGLVNTLSGNLRNLVGVINNIKEAKA